MRAAAGGWYGAITDVPQVQVGHAQRVGDGWLTGVTVVLPPPGTVGAVDVRGGGPGTHETDALDPTTLVPTVDAVCLTGGSAFGLAAAGGVQAWCEQAGRGFPAGPPPDRRSILVPIVPAAAVFDLARGGDAHARPDAALGRLAAQAAGSSPAPAGTPTNPLAAGTPENPPAGTARGCIGAGTGTVLAAGRLKGGIGTASVRLPGGLVVGAIAVVNALGSPVDPVTGALLGTFAVPRGLPRPRLPHPDEAAALAAWLTPPALPAPPPPAANTTLAVVATNAALDPARARRMATTAHDGLARALNPTHTLLDGDTVFALATGQVPASDDLLLGLHAAAADAVLLAVLDGVLAATTTRTPALDAPAYLDLCPSARPLDRVPGAGNG